MSRRREIQARLDHLYNEKAHLETRKEQGEGVFNDHDQTVLDMVNDEIREMEQALMFAN